MSREKPWWWPQIINDEHLDRLRTDYPEKANMSDESLLEYFVNRLAIKNNIILINKQV